MINTRASRQPPESSSPEEDCMTPTREQEASLPLGSLGGECLLLGALLEIHAEGRYLR